MTAGKQIMQAPLPALSERQAKPTASGKMSFRFSAAGLTTPWSTIGHAVNTTIAFVAFYSSVALAPLALWALASYAVAGFVFYRWARRFDRKRRDLPTLSASGAAARRRRAILFGAMLAAPWGLLAFWLLGGLAEHQEIILIALCVGMSASGSVLLSATYPAALAYMACVLAPVAIRCFALGGQSYLLLGALTLSYAVFLLNCINSCATLFAEKRRAVDDLSRSLAVAEEARCELEHAAMHDALTGLPNRRAFLGQSLLSNESGDVLYALFYIDLDRFKPINDAFGHAAGDCLLRQVGARLAACARPGDFVARLGGDEFVSLIPGIGDETEAEARAAAMLDALNQPYEIEGRPVNVGASIGISLTGRDVTDTAQLLKTADLALYRAKFQAENRFCSYRVYMLTRLRERQEIEEALQDALNENQFELHFQPIVELGSLALVGAEALLRWQHPKRGMILPEEFLRIAEEIGLLQAIETWALEDACRQAALWPGNLTIAVNVSASLVANTQIAGTVAQILSAMGLQPSRLELEVTESTVLSNDGATLHKLQELKSLKVSLAMDDFGTGYSSLAYLSRFPFDRLKIDRSFVQGLREDGGNPILQATAELARGLGLHTTAEGIENRSQLSQLRRLGIELGQGHLFGGPVTACELPAHFLRRSGFASAGDGERKIARADGLGKNPAALA
jgi:diguanylate cyclase (GGDEF)-like protein